MGEIQIEKVLEITNSINDNLLLSKEHHDTIWLLEKNIGKHVLLIEGKDVESREIHLKHSIFNNNWISIEKSNDALTPERSEILNFLSEHKDEIKTSELLTI